MTLLGGAAAAWPLAAHAQQPEPIRQASVAAFRQALQQLGWSDGRNVRIDIGWGEDDVDRERKHAVELIALAPDIMLASGTLSLAAVQ